VADVQDLAGNQVMPPDRDHPYSVTFLGTGTSGPRADSDGDGLSDAGEQAGWIVTVRKSNGELGRSEVTSDPGLADTDADGMSDLDELIYLINPRSPDTDGDGLTDYQELNFIYSDPTGQDSDEDGLQDGLEYNFFKTSPILADTDGDQLPDGNEATSGNRNPLIADLPRISIAVGDVNLELDERYSYTDTEGQSQEVSSSTSTTLEQGTERTYSTSDTSTLSSALKFSQEVKGTYEFPKTFGVEVSAGFEQSSAEEYTTNVSQESAQRSSTAYNESVAKTNSFQSSSEVSREVMGASMKLSLDLGSISDVAFSVSNLEVTALWQDPVDPTRLVPIATLVPSAQLTGGTPTYNLGPFVPTKGPVMFENREVFPKTVEQLLKSPRGLVFKVANYDILAEDGRNFAFSSQETYDRTVGITIDYGGDGRAVERYRVATDTGSIVPFYDSNEDGTLALHCGAGDSCDNNGDGTVDAGDRIVFDANGDPVGITMADALALLGVEYKQDTTDTETNRRVLTELNGVANDAGNHQAWVTFYSTAVDPSMQHRSVLIREADFDDVVLHAGDTYILAYSQDKDEDKLFAREEYLYGSSDDWDNSDDNGGSDDDTCPTGEGYGFSYFQDDPSATLPLDHPSFTCDTLSDFEEVRDGWTVAIRGETEYKAYSSPRLADSDSDGLVDHDEQTLGTDPRKRDTDEDGITDFDEVYGFKIRFRGDLKFSDLTDKFCTALITGGTCTSTEDYVTNPLDPDTDGDGIEDGFEIGMGANPQNADAEDFIDTDQDGLADSVEDEGWTITVNGVETSVFSSKYEPDTDGDGLPDLLENMVGSNPLDATTDGNEDGLSDYQELNIQTYATKIDRSFDLNKFLNTCGSSLYNATRCVYDAANSPAYGTDPSNSDSDHDGLNDDFELFDSWNIKVAGQDAYAATLDPVEANADDDGWDDGEEYRNGTDPNLASTDGDAKDDDDEASKCAGGECQDPLVPDQLITVTYTQITFKNGCEGSAEIDDEGEFFWVLNLVRPDGTTIRVDDGENYGVDEEEAPKVKSLAGEAPSQQFVKAYSESFRLTGNIYESDAAPNDDDCVGSWDTAYPGELTKTSDSFSEGSDWTVDVSLKVD
ncbi:MAG TPA: hypothetical protein VF171_00845, partial [Trueperaceae bacterium]